MRRNGLALFLILLLSLIATSVTSAQYDKKYSVLGRRAVIDDSIRTKVFTANGAATFNSTVSITGAATHTSSTKFSGIVLYDSSRVAAADSMTLPSKPLIYVTGTGKATYIQPGTNGQVAVLISASTDTLVDGKNLKLAGNYYGATSNVIQLIYYAGNWYELFRSANN